MKKLRKALHCPLHIIFLITVTLAASSCWVEDDGEYSLFVISNNGNFTGNYLVDGEIDGLSFFDGTIYEADSTYYTYEEIIDFNSIDISVTKENEAASVEIIIYKGDYQVAKEEIEEYECASYDSDGETCLTYTDTASLYYENTESTETTE